MAASRSTNQPARQSYRRQALIWLVMTLLLGIVTALIWMFSQTPAIGAKIENEPISAPQTLDVELKQPLSIESLHELDTDVLPINFDATVRDLRSYPDEFKDKRYLLANKGKWTVQVMNVAENDVIVSYLEGREDRKKFTYFRYHDDDNQLRYMLTYGLMSSPQEAVGAAKLIDFRLPANVRVLPEEINRYVSIIDNYERPDPVKDLSTRRARSVNLRPTKREVPVRQQKQVSTDERASSSAANSSSNSVTANTSPESIRKSTDTSATLTVNEERTVVTEEQSSSVASPQNEDKSRKPEQESKKASGLETDSSAPKKPPVVATPKPPSATTSSGTNPASNSANKNASPDAAKNNNDSIKELIKEKNN